MPRGKRKQKAAPASNHNSYAKIAAAVLGLAATGGSGLSYATSKGADERTAVLETKVARQIEDRKQDREDIDKIARRTIRIEEAVKSIAEKMGVKRQRNLGPDER